jgi:hypothetical protein
MTKECDKVITIPQYSGTCWFNAILMAFFYSEGMRAVLKENLKNWTVSPKLRKIFTDILKRRYKAYVMKQHAYLFFKVITPEEILRILNEEAPATFNFKPFKRIGYLNVTYIPRLLDMFGVPALHLDAQVKGSKVSLYYSIVYAGIKLQTVPPKNPNKKNVQYILRYNDEPLHIEIGTPDVVVVKFFEPKVRLLKANLFAEVPLSVFESGDPIKVYDKEYVHDAFTLANFNIDSCRKGHDIAGVTCENQRFMYNGWTRETADPALAKEAAKKSKPLPCELMPFDWLRNNDDFCIDSKQCGLREAGVLDKKREICFNISKGNRTFILVAKKYRN